MISGQPAKDWCRNREVSTGRCGGSRRGEAKRTGSQSTCCTKPKTTVLKCVTRFIHICSSHLIYHRIDWWEKCTFLQMTSSQKKFICFHTQRGLAERLLISQTWKDLRSCWLPHVLLSNRLLGGGLMSYIDPYGAACTAHAATCTRLQTEVELRAGMLLIFLLSFWKRKNNPEVIRIWNKHNPSLLH